MAVQSGNYRESPESVYEHDGTGLAARNARMNAYEIQRITASRPRSNSSWAIANRLRIESSMSADASGLRAPRLPQMRPTPLESESSLESSERVAPPTFARRTTDST